MVREKKPLRMVAKCFCPLQFWKTYLSKTSARRLISLAVFSRSGFTCALESNTSTLSVKYWGTTTSSIITKQDLEAQDVQYSKIRRLSGLDYALTHNIQDNTLPLEFTTRKHFQWNPGLSVAAPASQHNAEKQQNYLKDVKKEEKTRKSGNIWWPWASYEDWLANNERKDDKNSSDNSGLESKEADKTKSRTYDKNRKQKRLKTKKESRLKKYKLNKRKSKNYLKQLVDSLPDNNPRKLSSSLLPKKAKYLGPLRRSKISSEKDLLKNNFQSINNPQIDNKMLRYNLEHKEAFTNEESTLNHINYSGKINKMSGHEVDNEIKKIYNTLPYWKESLIETASRNYPSDLNECLVNNGGCEGLCINTKGSFRCHCPPGFKLDASKKKCHDINECLSRNGHGPCDGDCINTWGSYECNCRSIPGTTLASDGTHCKPLDDCAEANCSHSCIPTRAGPFCSCPLGLQLADDWKTCTDINECMDAERNLCVEHTDCINTFGSFKCSIES